ncbi:MAG: iron chaperone [Aquaticitalea sp.]
MNKKTFQNIDDYISEFPEDVAILLKEIRTCIKKAAPNSEEVISYNMPAFKENNKVLVYFAAFKNHIGFYALPSGNKAFQKDLIKY